jgi:mannose-6-phosphate isomerase-like protein (cupin superfamily)
MNLTRRKACLSLVFLRRVTAWASETASLPSKAYPFEDLPTNKDVSATYRNILQGDTHTGNRLEMHETVLEPGAMPHPPHRHGHEELFAISTGTLEITIAGKNTKLTPGSAAFVASNEEHSLRNIGTTPAQYFVIALGRDVS